MLPSTVKGATSVNQGSTEKGRGQCLTFQKVTYQSWVSIVRQEEMVGEWKQVNVSKSGMSLNQS